MGNESSQLSGMEIEDKPIEITDFWSQYRATINDSCRYFSLKSDGSITVFKGEAALGPLWISATPLEKFSNNLLKFRHPCIIRYISAWQQRSTLHLATEYIQPLSQLLPSQTPLQIFIGLNNILRALVFLHEQAGMSHNNVSVSAVYVTGDGQWKLGGLQYLCSFHELTSTYLKQARIHRYDKAIDSNEDTNEVITKVDQYAFAVLVEDVFKGVKKDAIPHLEEFKTYCLKCLQHTNTNNRPALSEVLQHDFFNHEFISIYKFLNFLPLKSEDEKHTFFCNILGILKCYDEETVAKQFVGLLLSRLTLLDYTARKDVIPFILKPKNERSTSADSAGFFSLSIFKEHVKPRLVQLFGVRDSQIRTLLLAHFSKFVHVFSHDELSQHILPELLVGIKDTDDVLVASTLICLSELVPILGADAVVGGKRSKLFADGRPNSKTSNIAPKSYSTAKSLKDLPCSEEIFHHSDSSTLNYDKDISLNERPSPVGGESIDNEIIIRNDKLPENEDDWSDWDNNNHQLNIMPLDDLEIQYDESRDTKYEHSQTSSKNKTSLLQKAALEAKKNIVDISELDIKNQKIESSRKQTDEFDFFADMAPIIEKPTVVSITQSETTEDLSSKLNFVPEDSVCENDGWGENWEE